MGSFTAVEAFDAICEHATDNATRGPLPHGFAAQADRIHQHQLEVTQRELDSALWRTAWSISRDGASYALKCRCHGVTLGFPCHSRSIRRILVLRAETITRGGPRRGGRLGGGIDRLGMPLGRAREAGTNGVALPPGKRRRRQGRGGARETPRNGWTRPRGRVRSRGRPPQKRTPSFNGDSIASARRRPAARRRV